MLVIALLVTLGTLPAHAELTRLSECDVANAIHDEGRDTGTDSAQRAWRRAAAARGYLITLEDGSNQRFPEDYQLWHGDRLVAVWDGVTRATACGEQD